VDRFGLPPVDDVGLDEAGGLVGLVAFTLDEEEALFVGVALAEDVVLTFLVADEPADVAPGPWLVQDGSGLGRTLFLPGSREAKLELELEPALGLVVGDLVGVPVEESLTLGLGLPLGLLLGLEEGLELVALPLLWLPLDDVTGAVVVAVTVLGGLALVSACAGWVDGDEQAIGVVLLLLDATPGEEGSVSSAAEGCGAVVWPSVAPAPVEGLLLVKAWLMSWPTFENAVRAGGTSDRTTPMANTAAPRAKAGRSMASRQSRRGRDACRCGADRWEAGRPVWPGTRRRASPARKRQIASQAPSAPLGRA
jgi:hypothetical protein